MNNAGLAGLLAPFRYHSSGNVSPHPWHLHGALCIRDMICVMARFSRTCGESAVLRLSNREVSRWENWGSSFRVHRLSRSHRMRLLVAGLALLAASCGASGNTPVSEPASTATSSTASSTPSLTVSPNTGLVGGQQLQVSITAFPHDATVMVYQCASAASVANSNTCGSSIFVYTAGSGGASGPFIAQPSVGGAQTRSTCQDQCVLVGVVIKEGARVPPSPPPMATSPLSFSTTGTQGLKDAFLQDLSWISATEGWAMASQPCATGLCVRLAHITGRNKGAHALSPVFTALASTSQTATPRSGSLSRSSLR